MPPEVQEAWGCSGPAPETVWSSSCPACAVGLADCQVCHGSGFEEHLRCPGRILGNGSSLMRAELRMAYQFGLLPFAGGLRAQPAAWVQALELYGAELGAIQAELDRRRRQGSPLT